MREPIKVKGTPIGLIGCGRWGKFILRDLVSLECEVWVVANSTLSMKNASEYGAHKIVGLVSELHQDLAGYVVAVPTLYHAKVIKQLLSRDRPIFVEKPMTPDPILAQELVKLAGDRLFVMDKWRYHPGIEKIAALVRSGELGKPRVLTTKRTQWGSPHKDVDAVWILLPHDLSITLHILNELPEPIWAISEQAEDRLISLFGQLGYDPTIFIEVSAHTVGKERKISVSFEEGAIVDGRSLRETSQEICQI